MNSRVILLTIRVAAGVLAAAFTIEYARRYLEREGFSIPGPVFSLSAYLLVLMVLWLSTRNLAHHLSAYAEARQQHRQAGQHGERGIRATVHRYPPSLIFLILALGVVAALLPYLPQESPASTSVYISCIGIAFCMLVVAVHLMTYRVLVGSASISIQTAVRTQEIALSEIRNVEVVTTRNGRQIVVSLSNNKAVRFGRMLTDFDSLLDALLMNADAARSARS